MAPTGRKRARARARTRTSRKTQYKRAVVKPKSIKEAYSTVDQDFPSNSSASCDDCSRIDGLDFEGVDISTSACSTPKAERFRIPEIQTCPPAPRKQRMISICSLQRRPIAFFAPPDLELFFFYALQV